MWEPAFSFCVLLLCVCCYLWLSLIGRVVVLCMVWLVLYSQQWVREDKGFVSIYSVLVTGPQRVASSLFCHLPSSLSFMWICKGEDPSTSVQPHTLVQGLQHRHGTCYGWCMSKVPVRWKQFYAFSEGKQMTDLAVPDTAWAPETLSPSREPQVNEMENAGGRFHAIRNHQTCTNCPRTSELCLISKAKALLIPDS